MKITDLLSRDAISTDIGSTEKGEVVKELVSLLVSAGEIKKADMSVVLKKLQEREMLGSTGIGKGVAIPHAKCDKVKKMVAAFGVSKEGVDFRSLDGEKTHIFFLLIAPGETPGPHLKALAKISRLLDDKFVRDRLRSAGTPLEITKIMKEEEQKTIH
jgi:fructose-specific phosphotransferase system IIA component